jgi:hypothetical protein
VPEGPKFPAFHPPVLPPDVFAGGVDVFPAEGRQVFKQVVADQQTMCFQALSLQEFLNLFRSRDTVGL